MGDHSEVCTSCGEYLDYGHPMITCDRQYESKVFCNENCWFDHLNGIEKAQVILEKFKEAAHV